MTKKKQGSRGATSRGKNTARGAKGAGQREPEATSQSDSEPDPTDEAAGEEGSQETPPAEDPTPEENPDAGGKDATEEGDHEDKPPEKDPDAGGAQAAFREGLRVCLAEELDDLLEGTANDRRALVATLAKQLAGASEEQVDGVIGYSPQLVEDRGLRIPAGRWDDFAPAVRAAYKAAGALV